MKKIINFCCNVAIILYVSYSLFILINMIDDACIEIAKQIIYIQNFENIKVIKADISMKRSQIEGIFTEINILYNGDSLLSSYKKIHDIKIISVDEFILIDNLMSLSKSQLEDTNNIKHLLGAVEILSRLTSVSFDLWLKKYIFVKSIMCTSEYQY